MYQCNCKRCTWQSVPYTTVLRSDYNSPTILESRAPKATKWFIFSAFSHLFAFPLGFFLHQNWLIYILVSKIISMQFNSWQTIYARSWVNSYGRFESAYYISQVCYNNIIDDPLQCTHTQTHAIVYFKLVWCKFELSSISHFSFYNWAVQFGVRIAIKMPIYCQIELKVLLNGQHLLSACHTLCLSLSPSLIYLHIMRGMQRAVNVRTWRVKLLSAALVCARETCGQLSAL